MPIDSLQKLVDVMQTKVNNNFDLIDKVDNFYNNAWNKLIIVGSAGFAIVGIIMPLIIQWYQKRTLILREELLKKEIEKLANQNKEKISEELTQKIQLKFTEYENKIEMLAKTANANILLLQGKFNLEKSLYPDALADFVKSSTSFLECEDYGGLQSVLNLILNDCLPYISYEDINDLKVSNDCDLDFFLADLKTNDEKGIFLSIIQEIKVKVTKLPKTKPPKPVEDSPNK